MMVLGKGLAKTLVEWATIFVAVARIETRFGASSGLDTAAKDAAYSTGFSRWLSKAVLFRLYRNPFWHQFWSRYAAKSAATRPAFLAG